MSPSPDDPQKPDRPSLGAEFDSAIGARIREVRTASGVSADEVARLARFYGLSWRRSTVASIESGERSLSAAELLVLPTILAGAHVDQNALPELLNFQCWMTETLVYKPKAFTELLGGGLPNSRSMGTPAAFDAARAHVELLSEVVDLVTRHIPITEPSGGGPDHVPAVIARAAGGDAEQKAARSLGLSATELAVIAVRLWGCGLTEEREKRLAAAGTEPASAGSRRAYRGRVTRVLLDEIRAYLDQRLKPTPTQR